MATPTARKVTVVGAGIVGVACPSYLQRACHDVTLLDRNGPREAMTSFGNAGGISPGSVVPIAVPGMLKQIPKWLLDPTGPLFLRWPYLPRILPWLIRFIRAGRESRVREISGALATLNGPSFDAYIPLIEDAGVAHLFHRTGQLFVYRSKAGLEKDMLTQELRRAAGSRVEFLDADEIRQLEPALAPIFEAGVFMPDNGHCKNPFGLLQALTEQFVRAGGTALRREVTGFDIGPNGPRKLHTDAGDMDIDILVVSTGAWSHKLTAQLGHRVPLESHRGYHVTISDLGVVPRIMCFPVDHKFAITPMEIGLRLAGTVELAGLDAPPNYERARVPAHRPVRLTGPQDGRIHGVDRPSTMPAGQPSRDRPLDAVQQCVFRIRPRPSGSAGRISDRQSDRRDGERPPAVHGSHTVSGRPVLMRPVQLD